MTKPVKKITADHKRGVPSQTFSPSQRFRILTGDDEKST
jgi:hypothetical protein